MNRSIIQVGRVAKRCSVTTDGSYCAYSGSSLAGVIGLKLADNVDNNSREIIFTFVQEMRDPDCFLGLNSSFQKERTRYCTLNGMPAPSLMTRSRCHDERCGTFRTRRWKLTLYAFAENMHMQIYTQD